MTANSDGNPLADDVPQADAVEQRQPADASVEEEAGIDIAYLANLIQRDADPADVLDQTISVPLPDEERHVDTDPF